MAVPVYLESGAKKVFACSLDWPGWCRSAKDEEAALEALAAYAPRYAPVAQAARLAFPARPRFDVVERVAGSATTDFGAPAAFARSDAGPLRRREGARLVALVTAAWAALDRAAAGAPAELRKGPRGGGRDRDRIVEHVLDAEGAYARKLGIRHKPAAGADLRAAVLDTLQHPVEGAAWPVRYGARRFAWHALDHAWEIEDRTVP